MTLQIGYDLLVTKDDALDLNKASLRFVEIKHELKRDFDHSFKKLAAVMCWQTNLSNEDEVRDLSGEKRYVRITPPGENKETAYTKYMLMSNTEAHNIEIFVLKQYLEEKLHIKFTPR